MDLLELLRPQVAAVPASSVTSSRPPSVETGWRHAKSLRRLLQESSECQIDIAFTKIRDIFFGHLRMNKKRVTADVGGMRRDQQRRKADANVGFHDLLGHDAKVCRASLARKMLRTWQRGRGDPSDASTTLLHETPMWKVVRRGFFLGARTLMYPGHVDVLSEDENCWWQPTCARSGLQRRMCLSSDLIKTKATTNNKPAKTTNRGPATLINASEPHPRFQRRYRPTSFQVARGLKQVYLDEFFLHGASFLFAKQRSGQGPCTLALRVSPCFLYREPIIVSVTAR